MRRAFTLIEVMVATSLFATVATVALSAIASANAAYHRVADLRLVLDNINASFDIMTRNIRYGQIFFCGTDINDAERTYRKSCPMVTGGSWTASGGSVLVFRAASAASADDRVGYYVDTNSLRQFNYTSGVVQSPTQLTSDDIVIDNLRFFVNGAQTTQAAIDAGNTDNAASTLPDNEQPTITIVLAGYIRSRNQNAAWNNIPFDIETTVTPRQLDI